MNAANHSFAPEELMAYLDGELTGTEDTQMAAHLEECPECRALASELRTTSKFLAAWAVEPAPASIGEAVDRHRKPSQMEPGCQQAGSDAFKRWHGSKYGVAAVCGLLLVAVFINRRHEQMPEHALSVETTPEMAQQSGADRVADFPAREDRSAAATQFLVKELEQQRMSSLLVPLKNKASAAASDSSASASGPMIARSIALTLEVKDCILARSTLDAIVARHHGYAATLALSTPAGGPSTFSASLRIPVPELGAALAEIRSTGRVLEEKQSGEEVTPQHTDLEARLRNARETEDRLRQLVATHAGKVEDLLHAEEQIGEVRGQIESMEAELRNLDHRIDFATVDLDCSEQYHEQLESGQSGKAGTQIANAFVSGLRRAVSTILGLMLFIEDYGPSILVWVLLLGVPVFLLVRRYRSLRLRL
jgi:Domain of unknown function (DUF4349)/Putative zinc-finger